MTARQSTFSFRFGAAALAAVAAFIAGCAVQPGIEGQAIDTESRPETKNLSALMEAGDRKQLTCTSMQPLSAQRALNDIVFSCPEFDIGSETSHDGVVEMPLTIQIIKLF